MALGWPPSGTGGWPDHRVLRVEREACAPRTTRSFAHWPGLSRRPIPGLTGHMTKEVAFTDWLRAASLIRTWRWGEPAHPNGINQTWQEGCSRWKIRVALSEAAGIRARRAQTTQARSSLQEGSCRSLGRAQNSTVSLQLGLGDPLPWPVSSVVRQWALEMRGRHYFHTKNLAVAGEQIPQFEQGLSQESLEV